MVDRGTYAAASAGAYQMRMLDTVANNLANAGTTGYKRKLLVGSTQSFDETFAKSVQSIDPFAASDHQRTPGVTHVTDKIDFSPGAIKFTGANLDVALRDPSAFFVVNTPDGPQYTRAGSFTLNQDGVLVTQDGFEVNGDSGPITATGANTSILPGGQVISGGLPIGSIQTVKIDQPDQLDAVGNSRFKLPRNGIATPTDAQLVPQSLEMANISVVSSMVDLIAAHRGFEAYTKVAQTIDQLNQDAITSVGRRR